MEMAKNNTLEISRYHTLRMQLCKNTLLGRDGESNQRLGGNVPPGEIAWLVAEGGLAGVEEDRAVRVVDQEDTQGEGRSRYGL